MPKLNTLEENTRLASLANTRVAMPEGMNPDGPEGTNRFLVSPPPISATLHNWLLRGGGGGGAPDDDEDGCPDVGGGGGGGGAVDHGKPG